MSLIVIEPTDYKTLKEIIELLETPSDIEVYLGGEFDYTCVAEQVKEIELEIEIRYPCDSRFGCKTDSKVLFNLYKRYSEERAERKPKPS